MCFTAVSSRMIQRKGSEVIKMEYVETTKEEIEEAKECCKTLNCGDCPLKESDYCTEQIESC